MKVAIDQSQQKKVRSESDPMISSNLGDVR